MDPVIDWLLASDEPWTRYRTLVDLLHRSSDDAEVQAAHRAVLEDARIRALIEDASRWEQQPIRRHNDAGHALAKLAVLADFGLRATDPQITPIVEAVLAHQSVGGALQSVLNIAPAYGGTGQDQWAWVLCDAPTLLYTLLALGVGDDPRVQQAVEHLVGLAAAGGWQCVAAPELGRFRGPGRKDDPCPIATLLSLRALARVPALVDSSATRAGAEMLLWHWGHQAERKLYLFGIGTDFRRLKYPYVWYDVLHVADVLSRFPFVHRDPRFREIVETVAAQADSAGRYTAGSMYQSWKGWSFAAKKAASPWLTFLVLRIVDRVQDRR